MLSEGFPLVWKHRIVKLKPECVFWHLLSESNLPAIVAIFSCKRRKGKSVRVQRRSQGHTNCVWICACPLSLSSCGEVTLTLGMAPLHVILQSVATVTLDTIISLTTGMEDDWWMVGGQGCGGRRVKLLEKMPPFFSPSSHLFVILSFASWLSVTASSAWMPLSLWKNKGRAVRWWWWWEVGV